MVMKKYMLAAFMVLATIPAIAQDDTTVEQKDSTATTDTQTAVQDSTFCAYLYEDDYQVILNIDLYNQNISVPGQEIFGELPGWFGSKRDSRKWLITSAEINGKTAILEIVNDYGSEDLTASLTRNDDGTYTFTQLEGSTLKIVVDRKWVKIPKKLVLKRKP